MTSISLPDPGVRRAGPPVDADALARDLRRRADAEVRFDAAAAAPTVRTHRTTARSPSAWSYHAPSRQAPR